MGSFESKVAIVTGGGAGIGRVLCLALAARGATVVVVDRDAEAAAATAATAGGGRAIALTADVTDAARVQEVVDGVVAGYGRLDLMVNNAGVSGNGEFCDIPPEAWHRIMDVNLWGVVHGCRSAYPVMVRQGFGHLVNVASLAGLIPGGLTTAYSASKHAVVGFTLTLRGEARQYGVRVSALCPGYLGTDIQRTTPTYTAYMDSEANRAREAATAALTPEDCVDQMLAGIARNRAVIISPRRYRPYWWVHRAVPGLLPVMWDRIIRSLKRDAG